jgi:hypothetical protein
MDWRSSDRMVDAEGGDAMAVQQAQPVRFNFYR